MVFPKFPGKAGRALSGNYWDTPTGQPELDRTRIIPREVGRMNWKQGNLENKMSFTSCQETEGKETRMDLIPNKWDWLVYCQHCHSIHGSSSHCVILDMGIPSSQPGLLPLNDTLAGLEPGTISRIFNGKRWKSGILWLSRGF